MSDCISDWIIVLSTIFTAIATIAIAFLTKSNRSLSEKTFNLTKQIYELNKTVNERNEQHQNDLKNLQVDLVAASLLASTTISGKGLKTDRLDEFRRIVTNNFQTK